MKILLAVDGSSGSDAAINEVCDRVWPGDTEVRVISVTQIPAPLGGEPIASDLYITMLQEERKRVAYAAKAASEQVRRRAPGLRVDHVVAEGNAKAEILAEADRWGADLVILGSHGRSAIQRFLLGSVAQSVALHAHCSVEIARRRSMDTVA